MPGSPKKAARRARWVQYCQTRSPACLRLEIEASGLSMLDWATINDFAYTQVRDYARQDQQEQTNGTEEKPPNARSG